MNRTENQVHRLMSKIKDIESLRKYGLDEDEIIELQELKRESRDKEEEYKV